MGVLSRVRKAVGFYLHEKWNCREQGLTWVHDKEYMADNQWWMQLGDRIFFSKAEIRVREQERITNLFAKNDSGSMTLGWLWLRYKEEYGYSSYGIGFLDPPDLFAEFVRSMSEAGVLEKTLERTTEPVILTGPERHIITLFKLNSPQGHKPQSELAAA